MSEVPGKGELVVVVVVEVVRDVVKSVDVGLSVAVGVAAAEVGIAAAGGEGNPGFGT